MTGRAAARAPGRAAVVDALVDAAAPGRPGAVLTAADGCGATTVLAAVAAALAAEGRPVTLVTASARTAGVLGATLAGADPADPADPATPATDGEPTGAPDGPTAATLAASARLEALTAADGAVIVVDDVQWADATSAALLGAAGATGRATVVLGRRAGTRLPPPLAPLLRDPDVVRAELGPLDHDDVAALAEGVLGAPASPPLVAALAATTDGRPGAVVAEARAARAAGAIVLRRGVWDRVTSTGRRGEGQTGSDPDRRPDAWGPTPPVPGSGGTAVGGDAPGAEATALALVVAAGAPPLDAVEAVVGLAVLDDLERRGLLAVEERGEHLHLVAARPSVAAAVEATLTEEARRRALVALVDALDASDGSAAGVDEVDAVTWRLGAGTEVAPARVLAAAGTALARGDVERAATLAGAAPPSTGAAVVGALARWRRGDAAAALAALDAAAAGAVGAELVEVERHRLLIRVHATDEVRAALATADGVLAGLDADARTELLPSFAYLALMAGWPDRADEAARTWLATAPARHPRRAQADLVTVFAAVQRGEDPPPASGPVAGAGADDDAVLTWHRGAAAGDALGLLHRGDVAGSIAAADALRVEAAADHDPLMVGWGSVVGGLARLQAGALVAAQDDWVTAWRTFVPLGLDSRLRAVRSGLRVVEAFAAAGVRDLAAAGWFDAVSDGPGMLLHGEQLRLDLLGAVVTGAPDAEARLRRALVGLDERRMAAVGAAVAHLLTLVTGDGADVADLEGRAARVAGPAATRWSEEARARCAGDGPTHLAAVDALVAAGDALAAHLALTARRRAHGPDRGGDERLRALARTTDLPLPPALAGGADRLAPREREVAGLVAGGATSREVAEALGLSVRTVDATLAKVYRKLGIAGRHDLATALEPWPTKGV